MLVTVGFSYKDVTIIHEVKYCRVQLILVSVPGRLFGPVTNMTCASKTVCREA